MKRMGLNKYEMQHEHRNPYVRRKFPSRILLVVTMAHVRICTRVNQCKEYIKSSYKKINNHNGEVESGEINTTNCTQPKEAKEDTAARGLTLILVI